jgi:hypothetical protein
MAVNLTTLFTRWGKMIFAANTLDTARLNTVPDEVQDVLDEFSGASASPGRRRAGRVERPLS